VPKSFKDNEECYSKWLASHRAGFVFNHLPSHGAKLNVIHRANCRDLYRSADEGRRTVYEKVCSEGLDELEPEATRLRALDRKRGWHHCRHCFKDRRKEAVRPA
jgi:hypothetical protein